MADFKVKGRLGADVEVDYTNNNKAYAKFSIAESIRRKEDGEWKDIGTNWWNCIAWEKTAENMIGWSKGEFIDLTEASIAMEQWEDQDGEKRSAPKVTVYRAYKVYND